MNKKQLFIALGVCIALVIALILAFHNDDETWERASQTGRKKIFNDLDVNSIAKVVIRCEGKTITLQQNKDHWGVLERGLYPANYKDLSDILVTISELKVAQTVDVEKSKYPTIGLVSPEDGGRGISIILYNKKGDVEKSMILGALHFPQKEQESPYFSNRPDGRYMLIKGDDKPILVSAPLENVHTNPVAWLNMTFPKITNIDSISLADTKGNLAWALHRVNAKAALNVIGTKPKDKLVKTAIAAVENSIKGLSFLDVKERNKKNIEEFLKYSQVITVTTFDKMSYTLTLAISKKDSYLTIDTVALPTDDKKIQHHQKAILEQFKNISQWIFVIKNDLSKSILVQRQTLVKVAPKEVIKKKVTKKRKSRKKKKKKHSTKR